MYEFLIEWLPLIVLILLGISTVHPQPTKTNEQHYIALSKTVYGFTISFLILLVIDTFKDKFF